VSVCLTILHHTCLGMIFFNLNFSYSGYMAPKHVVDGLYSIKSDVFSFGILLLEIISGNKNRALCHGNQTLNLVCFRSRMGPKQLLRGLVFFLPVGWSRYSSTSFLACSSPFLTSLDSRSSREHRRHSDAQVSKGFDTR